jgi:hypothetical protein
MLLESRPEKGLDVGKWIWHESRNCFKKSAVTIHSQVTAKFVSKLPVANVF